MPAPEKFEKVLDKLSSLSGVEAAGIVSEDGLILAARAVRNIPEEKLAALLTDVVKVAEKVAKLANWGEIDNLIIEGDRGKAVVYTTKYGYVAIFGSNDLNLGLARVTAEEAVDILED